MATVYPTPSNVGVNTAQESPTQHGGPRQRNYTPYIFQPNFLKQQMRQRRDGFQAQMGFGTGANSVPLNDMGKMGAAGPQSSNMRPGTSHNSLAMGDTAGGVSLEDMQRKKSGRRVIDWTSSCVLYLENRKFQRDCVDTSELMPDTSFTMEMQTAIAYRENPVTSITSKFVRSATNKMKCPIYKVVWTPDGRRLVTGSASGEFTLWNGTAFNFETILQAHDSPVRAMAWSKYDCWLITGDNQGYIKYWQLNMNNVKMYQAHKDQACRSVSFGPTDHKFATASDDGTVRVWDFLRCHEERIMRGHGADVKQIDWHPHKGIVASASKDLHTPVKLWDPKTGQSITTIHAHKGTVMDIKWNQNGNWFLSASRDHLVKLYDIRNLKQEMQVFRGHKKEAFSVAWHPIHEDLFASGGSEGSIMFWQVGEEKESGTLDGAHDGLIWSLAWHPLGHVLVSGSNDHSTKFWARNRPGDSMRDRYNLCLLPQQHEEMLSSNAAASSSLADNEESKKEVSIIPGMGDTDAAAAEVAKRDEEEQKSGIPGLDWSYEEKNEFERKLSAQYDRKKIPYARPVPRAFVAAWEANKEGPPPDRPRSPFYRDRHRRPFDRPPRDFRRRDDGPFRSRGRRFGRPERRDSTDDDDDRIFVDGVEVGPDYKPEDMMDDKNNTPDIPGLMSPGRGPERRMSRGSDNHMGGRQEPPMGGREIPPDIPGPDRGPLGPRDPIGGPPLDRDRGRSIDMGPDMPPGPGQRDFPNRIPREDFRPDFRGERLPDSNFRKDLKDRPPFNDIDKNNPPFPDDYDMNLEERILEDERFLRENGFPIDDLELLAERVDLRGEPLPPDLGPGRMRGGPGRGRGFRARGDKRGFSPKRDKRGWGGRGRRSPPPRMRRGQGPPR